MILAVIEHSGAEAGNRLHPATNELVAFAQRAARELGVPANALILGSSVSSTADELKSRKLARVLVVDDAAVADYGPEAYVHALRAIASAEKPAMIVTMNSVRGIDFMPRA